MAMVERNNVEFGVEGGVTLRGWLFVPGAKGPAPEITMAHGHAGVKEHGLERFARAFAEAGFVVLVHDHRHFGASDGEERGDVDPWQQIADWRRAISFLEGRPEVDDAQIGIWGTSYAGGHAIVLGATDRRLRAVVAQVPTISGFEQGPRRVAPDRIAALERTFAEDDRGEPLRRQLVVSDDLAIPASYHNKDAIDILLAADSPGHLGELGHDPLHSGGPHV
jgi:dienelactone hydrolase